MNSELTVYQEIDYSQVNCFLLCVLVSLLVWNLYRDHSLVVVFLETDTSRPSYDRRHMISEQYESTLAELTCNMATKKHVPDTYLASYDPESNYWNIIGKHIATPSYISRRINTICHNIPVGPHLTLDIVREMILQKKGITNGRNNPVLEKRMYDLFRLIINFYLNKP